MAIYDDTDRRVETNTRFLEVAKLLGLTTDYFSGIYRVRLNGEYIGQKSAEAWLDHLRDGLVKSKQTTKT